MNAPLERVGHLPLRFRCCLAHLRIRLTDKVGGYSELRAPVVRHDANLLDRYIAPTDGYQRVTHGLAVE